MTSPDAGLRRARYGLLRWGFLAGEPRAAARVRGPEWIAAVEEAFHDAPTQALASLRTGLAAFGNAEALQGAYHALFGTRVQVSPYETDHTTVHPFQQAREIADVAGFYRAFGFAPARTGAERADHVGLELDFLYLLAHGELSAATRGDLEGVTRYREAALRFTEAHAGRFAAVLAARLAAASAHPFFVALAGLAVEAVEADVAGFGLSPTPPPRPEDILPMARDDVECAACPVAAGDEASGPRAP